MTPIAVAFGLAALAVGVLAAWFFIRYRRLEEQLTKAQASIGQTSRLLIDKNVELFDQNVSQQKQLAVKDDFIAIASHQLRTPLNEIIWGIGEIVDAPETETGVRAACREILSSGRRMEHLIEDLLAFVRVEQGGVRLASVAYDPDQVVQEAAKRASQDFKEKGITLTVNTGFHGTIESIDSPSLEMITSNIIENAFHYTPASGTILVSTRPTATQGFHFEVKDSGIGIPKNVAENMFVKFRRAPAAIEHNKEGSGLGLYTAKTLLDRAGGTISFGSEEGKGSTFFVELPRTR